MDLSKKQEQLKAVSGLYEMFMNGDTSKLESSVSPDYEQFPPQNPNVKPGLENFMKAFMEGFGSSFSEITGEITHLLADGDFVFARCEYSMIHSGEAYGIPATGKRISFDAFDLHRIEDGLVKQSWHLEDYMSIYNQIKD